MLIKGKLPSKISHPCLFISKKKIPELLRKFKRYGFLDAIIRRVRRELQNKLEEDYTLMRTKFIPLLPSIAFSFITTREEYFLNAFKEIVNIASKFDSWIMPEHRPLTIDLGVACFAYNIAIAYDWLYEYLDSNERNFIERLLVEKALKYYPEIHKRKLESWTKVVHNWRAVICSRLGICALALLNTYDKAINCIEESVKGVIDVLNGDVLNDDGSYDEGVTYWGYGIGEIVKFADVLKSLTNGSINLFNHHKLRETGFFGLYMATPDGGCFNFSDCINAPPNPWLMAKLASEYRNPYLQWYVVKHLEDSKDDILYALFFDPSVKPLNPSEGLPLGKVFEDLGVFVVRSSWDDENAIYLGLKSGHTLANHSHLDINSFVLYGYGRRIFIDLGIWPYAHFRGFFDTTGPRWDYDANATIGHNTILVDGQGQCYGKECKGRILNYHISNHFSYVFSDGAKAYSNLLRKFTRFLALIHPNLAVLSDLIECNGRRKVEWLFHYDGELLKLEREIMLENDDVITRITLLKPAIEEDIVLGECLRKSYFKATYVQALEYNKYFTISPLHKVEKCLFISLIQVFKKSTDWSLEPKLEVMNYEKFAVEFNIMGKRKRLEVDFSNNTSTLKSVKI